MAGTEPTTALAAMDVDECLRLLADHHFGRLGVLVGQQPLVFPLNYALAGRDIVFRTDSGTKLYGATERRVAFEIDEADTMYHSGWSVLVIGVAIEETDPIRVAQLARLPLTPWVPGLKSHWIRIRSDAMSGRRLAR
jgi:nitroimidazol reductase NimA-like FMN-containing flavoprotein (pyridoxamine 5'-phosphate oxidase superfamily)